MKIATAATPLNNLLGWLIRLQTPVSYQLEQDLFKQARQLVTVAQQTVNDLPTYGLSPAQARALANGVDADIFFPLKDPSSQPYFLTVGRLAPPKGLEDLIECADQVVKQFPAYRFYLAGSGPQEQSLRAEIARRNLDGHVLLLGHIANRARLVELYQHATAYVQASHYEGLPTVLLEAMACGRPVVSTSVSGALDVIRDGENGLLVLPKAPSQMAQALIRLIQNPTFGERLAQAGLKTVQEHFTWPVITRHYLAAYQRALAGGQP